MKSNNKTIVVKIVFCFILLFPSMVMGAPADPNPIKVEQPNGSYVTIILKGDEHIHWAESEDGYTLLRNRNGGWDYAVLDSSGDLTCSGFLAKEIRKRTCWEKKLLKRIPKKLNFSPKQINNK
jgi:hypothetical protein